MGTFAAQVKNANERSKEALRKIAATAIQDVMADAQTTVALGGNMPVDTAFLRNSLASSLNGSGMGEGAESYVLALASLEIGDTARFAWTAEYAMRRHYGFDGQDSLGRTYNEEGRMWIDKAASNWQSHVDAAAARFGK